LLHCEVEVPESPGFVGSILVERGCQDDLDVWGGMGHVFDVEKKDVFVPVSVSNTALACSLGDSV
jgi:hypothetical protein